MSTTSPTGISDGSFCAPTVSGSVVGEKQALGSTARPYAPSGTAAIVNAPAASVRTGLSGVSLRETSAFGTGRFLSSTTRPLMSCLAAAVSGSVTEVSWPRVTVTSAVAVR